MDQDGRVPPDVATHIVEQAMQLQRLAHQAEMPLLARLLAMVILEAKDNMHPKLDR